MKILWGLPVLAIGAVLYGCGGSGGTGGGGGVVAAADEKIFYALYNEEDNGDIYCVKPDGTGPDQLTNSDDDDFGPVGSLVNQKIYFCSNKGGTYQIWEMNDNGSGKRQVTSMPAGSYPWPASVSPDGKYLLATAFNVLNGSSKTDIVKIKISDGSYEALGSTDANDFDACYSPDGSKIVFGRENASNDLYTMDANGSNVTVLRATADEEEACRFSPSGTEILFTQRTAGGARIYKMPAAGGTATPITDAAANYKMGSFSRDGSQISVRRNVNVDSAEVGVVNTSNSSFTPLQTPAGYPSEPFWR